MKARKNEDEVGENAVLRDHTHTFTGIFCLQPAEREIFQKVFAVSQMRLRGQLASDGLIN